MDICPKAGRGGMPISANEARVNDAKVIGISKPSRKLNDDILYPFSLRQHQLQRTGDFTTADKSVHSAACKPWSVMMYAEKDV
jgi:hypothetical protein